MKIQVTTDGYHRPARFLIPLAADSLVRAETAIEELWATDQGAAS